MPGYLDNNRLPNYIAIIVLTLMATGAVFVFSAGAALETDLELQNFFEFTRLRQLLFFPCAAILMFVFSRANYQWLRAKKGLWRSPLPYVLFLSLVLLGLVLSPKFGTEINYARRWLRIPIGPISVSFQPSELAKWVTLFFVAVYCDFYKDSLHLYWKRFFPLCVVIAVVCGLVIIEDFGTAALIAVVSFLIMIIAGVRIRHVLALVPFGAGAFVGAVFMYPARIQRITAFLHPDQWADSLNYQANQSLVALGSGGLFGKGLGMGTCKYGHLPEDTTDFIFAIIGEELGLFGTLGILVLFMLFVWIGILVVVRTEDSLGRLLAGIIVLTLGFQAAINIGVVTVVLPTKGIPLPFVSAGGTSLLLSAAVTGLLLNVARQIETRDLSQAELNGGGM